MKLFFVTHNIHKFSEAQAVAAEYGFDLEWFSFEYEEIQHDDLETIAYDSCKKLVGLPDLKGKRFFLEDAGLFIRSLRGFPGPFSSYVFKTIGNDGILKLMNGFIDRSAFFMSVIAYYDLNTISLFKGITEGSITLQKRGSMGFGFDPIFTPYDATVNGLNQTYAEMSLETKNLYSHRQKSLRKLFTTLKRLRP